MILSEQLENDNNSGDFGKALEGYSERAKKIERMLESKDDQIRYLWKLLDDISTAGDIYKPEINNYFEYVNSKCEDRSDVANSFDGITLTIKET